MVFIDISNFAPDDQWALNAWLLNAELYRLESLTEKHRLIDENRLFWSEIKNQVPFNDKCWFSEAKESVSLYEIEHFRPTKATRRSKSVLKVLHTFTEASRIDWTRATNYWGGGYWWLAFDYTNYRNCGHKVNSKKGVRFPLKDQSPIAYRYEDDYSAEEVILLDPTKRGDPSLLTFDPDGKARPTIIDADSYEHLRAIASIDIYGLNAIEALVKHRETKWKECFKAIRRASTKFEQLEEAVNNNDLNTFTNVYSEFIDFINNDLRPAIDSQSEFSSVARACVLSYSNYPWINDYVLN